MSVHATVEQQRTAITIPRLPDEEFEYQEIWDSLIQEVKGIALTKLDIFAASDVTLLEDWQKKHMGYIPYERQQEWDILYSVVQCHQLIADFDDPIAPSRVPNWSAILNKFGRPTKSPVIVNEAWAYDVMTVLQGQPRRTRAAVVLPVVFVKKDSETDYVATGYVAMLTLELMVGDGFGMLYPDPSTMGLVYIDGDFEKSLANAMKYVRIANRWGIDDGIDVRWSLQSSDKQWDSKLEGDSLGGAFTLGLQMLAWDVGLSNSMPQHRIVRADRPLAHVVVTTAVSDNGAFMPVGGLTHKLQAIAKAHIGCYIVVVARKQDLSNFRMTLVETDETYLTLNWDDGNILIIGAKGSSAVFNALMAPKHLYWVLKHSLANEYREWIENGKLSSSEGLSEVFTDFDTERPSTPIALGERLLLLRSAIQHNRHKTEAMLLLQKHDEARLWAKYVFASEQAIDNQTKLEYTNLAQRFFGIPINEQNVSEFILHNAVSNSDIKSREAAALALSLMDEWQNYLDRAVSDVNMNVYQQWCRKTELLALVRSVNLTCLLGDKLTHSALIEYPAIWLQQIRIYLMLNREWVIETRRFVWQSMVIGLICIGIMRGVLLLMSPRGEDNILFYLIGVPSLYVILGVFWALCLGLGTTISKAILKVGFHNSLFPYSSKEPNFLLESSRNAVAIISGGGIAACVLSIVQVISTSAIAKALIYLFPMNLFVSGGVIGIYQLLHRTEEKNGANYTILAPLSLSLIFLIARIYIEFFFTPYANNVRAFDWSNPSFLFYHRKFLVNYFDGYFKEDSVIFDFMLYADPLLMGLAIAIGIILYQNVLKKDIS